MTKDLEQRVDALEKDVAEVKGEISALKKQTVKKPQDVDGMIGGLLYAAVSDAYDKAIQEDHPASDRTIPDDHTHKMEV